VMRGRLSEYAYHVQDHSISTWLLTPFWNACLGRIPTYVAPNVLTLSGSLCLLTSTYLTFCSTLSIETLALINAALLFAYQTLDALDGKQARRIANATPLGELFDHTFDCFGTTLITYNFLAVHGVTRYETFYITQLVVQLVFVRDFVLGLTQRVHLYDSIGPGEVLLTLEALLLMRALNIRSPVAFILTPTATMLLAWTAIALICTVLTLPYSYKGDVLYVACAVVTQLWTSFVPLTRSLLVCNTFFWPLVTSELILAKIDRKPIRHHTLLLMPLVFVDQYAFVTFAALHLMGLFRQVANRHNLPYLAVF